MSTKTANKTSESKNELDFIKTGHEYKNKVRSMIIVANHKIGKTSNLMQLDNSLLMDLEDSAGYYKGDHINIQELSERNPKVPRYKVFKGIIKKLKNSGVEYDYVIVDTLTVLSDIAEELGADRYRMSPQGQDFAEGESLFSLEYGLGYGYHRAAMLELIDDVKGLAKKTMILTAHIKDSATATPKGEIIAKDINLLGQLKTILPSRVDANATMYIDPEDENKRILSFKKHANDIVTGTRVPHLAGKEFIISEKKNPGTPEEELVTYWDKIFTE